MTIFSREEIEKIARKLRNEGKKIVFTNGCFDIIHAGHVKYLTKAKSRGDVLIVGLNSDESVKRLKGEGRPINDERDRAVVLSALKPVDYVSVFDEDTPLELIKAVKPDVLAKGADYKEEEVVGADFVKSRGGEVALIEYEEGKSTTKTIEKIKKIFIRDE